MTTENNRIQFNSKTHYSPLHKKGFSNHMPMFIHAQKILGIPENTITDRCQAYLDKLPLRNLEDPSLVLNDNEQDYIKQYKHYKKQLKEQDKTVLIRNAINKLESTLDANLFHGMIRLAFALKDPDTNELPKALSFWETAEITDYALPKDKPSENIEVAWNQLMDLRSNMSLTFDTKDTMEKVKQVVCIPKLMENITTLSTEDNLELKIAEILGMWYLQTRDFYVLHVINGFNALVQLKPYINDFNSWLNTFWKKAQVYSLITSERLPVIKMDIPSWDEIMKDFPVVDDIHDIKLFYSCKTLNQSYALDVYTKIAHILVHKYSGL